MGNIWGRNEEIGLEVAKMGILEQLDELKFIICVFINVET
jgi:hypothetical protein